MANKHKFTLAVNTVGCQEDVVSVSSGTLFQAMTLAETVFVASCQLSMVRGFDEFDKGDLIKMIAEVGAEVPGKSNHWRISDTQVIFIHREEF